jgi:hypothetical protein
VGEEQAANEESIVVICALDACVQMESATTKSKA